MLCGGARVLFDDRQLAMIHGCCGPAFFALTVAMAAFTSRFWTIASAVPDALNERLVRLGIFTAVLAYVQLVLGAAIRHVPIDATAAYFRGMVLFHLVMAVAVLVHAVLLSRAAWRYSGNSGMRAPATTLCGLVCVQVLLGAATWVVKYGWPAWLADEPVPA